MTHEEAKYVLGARRANGGDDADPRLAEALRLAGEDPELRAWLEREQRLDRAMVSGLRRVPVPQGLRDRIVAGGRVTAFPRGASWAGRWWSILAAAAVVLASVVGFLQWPRPASGPEGLTAELGRFLDHEWDHAFDLREKDFGKVRDWLVARESRVEMKVPERLSCSPTYGCKVFTWRGVEATLVCFLPKETGDVVHVVSLPKAALPEFTAEAPQYAAAGSWTTAMWRTGDRLYVAMTTADRELLAKAL